MLSQAAGRTLTAQCWGPSSDSRTSAPSMLSMDPVHPLNEHLATRLHRLSLIAGEKRLVGIVSARRGDKKGGDEMRGEAGRGDKLRGDEGERRGTDILGFTYMKLTAFVCKCNASSSRSSCKNSFLSRCALRLVSSHTPTAPSTLLRFPCPSPASRVTVSARPAGLQVSAPAA